jgi:hypothetical protein
MINEISKKKIEKAIEFLELNPERKYKLVQIEDSITTTDIEDIEYAIVNEGFFLYKIDNDTIEVRRFINKIEEVVLHKASDVNEFCKSNLISNNLYKKLCSNTIDQISKLQLNNIAFSLGVSLEDLRGRW